MSEEFKSANHLVLNLYLDGYSIAVKLNEFPVFTSETILETPKIAYEETSLLDYIENEELPPLLIEMIDSSPKLSKYKIWHNGCLILEVRDKTNMNQPLVDKSSSKRPTTNFRVSSRELPFQDHSRDEDLDFLWASSLDTQTTTSSKRYQADKIPVSGNNTSANNVDEFSSFFILLKPTNLSMLNDVLNLTESNCWSTQDRLQLESQIVLLNSPSLFLEPDAKKQFPDDNLQCSSSMYIGNNYLHRRRRQTHTRLANIYLKKINSNMNSSTIRLSSQRQQQGNASDRLPPELILQQFIATKRAKKTTFSLENLARFRRYKRNCNPKSLT